MQRAQDESGACTALSARCDVMTSDRTRPRSQPAAITPFLNWSLAAHGLCALGPTGFSHSAFSFGYESFVHKSSIDSNDVPPGALVSFVQKGLQYLELEANIVAEVQQWRPDRSCAF